MVRHYMVILMGGQVNRQLSPADLLGHALNDIERKYAPEKLFVTGVMKIPIPSPRVSIVGTRKPSPAGIETATVITKELVRHGVVIVSGLARGIDTAAHKAAIGNKGSTIAVLGTPLNKFYPAENYELQRLIMKEHLAVSQYPIGHITQRKDFILRNRTMALISNATVIVEAGETSGALSQGWEALRLGRQLYIWRSLFDEHILTWPKEMLKYGAQKLEDPRAIIDELPPPLMEPLKII